MWLKCALHLKKFYYSKKSIRTTGTIPIAGERDANLGKKGGKIAFFR
jgi:hypothetical protein